MAKRPGRPSKGRRAGHKQWYWGFKLHLVVDTTYELPVALTVTTARVHDVKQFIPVLERARALHPWLSPEWVTADAGYDARYVYEYVAGVLGAGPVIPLNRRWAGRDTRERQYVDSEGSPRCAGGWRMTFLGYTADRKLRYRCQRPNCEGLGGGIGYRCAAELILDPTRLPRLYSYIPRYTDAWKAAYATRQSVERVFSRLKGHRTLNDHARRGLRKVRLHILMVRADAPGRGRGEGGGGGCGGGATLHAPGGIKTEGPRGAPLYQPTNLLHLH